MIVVHFCLVNYMLNNIQNLIRVEHIDLKLHHIFRSIWLDSNLSGDFPDSLRLLSDLIVLIIEERVFIFIIARVLR